MVMNLNLTMGARNNAKTDRDNNDFYATHPITVRLFLDKLKCDGIVLNKNILEPACGMGHISKVFIDSGYNVTSKDLIYRGYGEVGDFLNNNEKFIGDIVTNPPYSLAKEFVHQGLKLVNDGRYAIFYVKFRFLESKGRYNSIFKDTNPKYVYVHSARQHTARNAEFKKYNAKTEMYCWLIFQKGFIGDTILRWI